MIKYSIQDFKGSLYFNTTNMRYKQLLQFVVCHQLDCCLVLTGIIRIYNLHDSNISLREKYITIILMKISFLSKGIYMI